MQATLRDTRARAKGKGTGSGLGGEDRANQCGSRLRESVVLGKVAFVRWGLGLARIRRDMHP